MRVRVTDDCADFDGTEEFGPTSQTLYVDPEGRYFCCEETPKFNPYTGEPITSVVESDE